MNRHRVMGRQWRALGLKFFLSLERESRNLWNILQGLYGTDRTTTGTEMEFLQTHTSVIPLWILYNVCKTVQGDRYDTVPILKKTCVR